MRKIVEIKYEVIKQSDVCDDMIYAFKNKSTGEVCVLVKKDQEYFWKSLLSTEWVWYQKYDTIEQAIDGILKVKEYKGRDHTTIMEFVCQGTFLNWALNNITE